jgi:hypothetical protein
MVLRDPPDHKVLRGNKVYQDRQELTGLKACRDLRDRQDLRVIKGFKD